MQYINNQNNILIKDKNNIINQIDSTKKKIEILKGKINKYENSSNEFLFKVDEFMKSLNA